MTTRLCENPVCPAGRPARVLCAACRRVAYCDKNCHRVHWPVHRLECATGPAQIANTIDVGRIGPGGGEALRRSRRSEKVELRTTFEYIEQLVDSPPTWLHRTARVVVPRTLNTDAAAAAAVRVFRRVWAEVEALRTFGSRRVLSEIVARYFAPYVSGAPAVRSFTEEWKYEGNIITRGYYTREGNQQRVRTFLATSVDSGVKVDVGLVFFRSLALNTVALGGVTATLGAPLNLTIEDRVTTSQVLALDTLHTAPGYGADVVRYFQRSLVERPEVFGFARAPAAIVLDVLRGLVYTPPQAHRDITHIVLVVLNKAAAQLEELRGTPPFNPSEVLIYQHSRPALERFYRQLGFETLLVTSNGGLVAPSGEAVKYSSDFLPFFDADGNELPANPATRFMVYAPAETLHRLSPQENYFKVPYINESL